jgi:hypothetical protein
VIDTGDWAFYLRLWLQLISRELLLLTWSPPFRVTTGVTRDSAVVAVFGAGSPL